MENSDIAGIFRKKENFDLYQKSWFIHVVCLEWFRIIFGQFVYILDYVAKNWCRARDVPIPR